MSDHKPASGNYAIWDDLRAILGVVDQLAWDQFFLLGHSRGAMMSALLAGAMPERIKGLVCLDGLLAEPAEADEFLAQLGNYLRDFSRPEGKTRVYPSLEDAAAARIKVMPMKMASALKIIQRGTVRDLEGSYVWRSDRRLSLASPVKLSMAQWQTVAKPKVPALLVCAEDGFGAEIKKMLPSVDQYFEVKSLPGDHHFHMDVAVEPIAALLRGFVTRVKSGKI